jgi:signal transduction histidine kinase
VDPALVARVVAQRAAAVADRDAIYSPLLAGERLLGVLVVVAPGAHDFDERARLIVATLCAYVAIALVNAEARAQRVQQEKLASLSSLVAGMAHEVNTPLGVIVSAISGVAEALRALQKAAAGGKMTRSALDSSVSGALEFADLAMRNADRVTHLVNSFKSIVVADDQEPERELDLSLYLPQVSALLRQELEAAGHRLVIDVEPGLKVRVVVGALTEVLVRVLENARDHAFEAGVRGTVTLRAERDPQGQVRLTVHDNGRGIPSAQLPRIFDPFFTTRPGAGGHTGLGLNVAFNHMTERLGGSLRIDSGPEGTTAELRF